MKAVLLLSLMTVTLFTTAQAKSLIGRVDSYIIVQTGTIVSIGTNQIEDDGSTATFYSHAHGKKITVNMSDLSKSTNAEIANVKAGKSVLINTASASGKVVSRACIVFDLFENKQAYVGCKTYEADNVNGYQTPARLDYIVQNVEVAVTAEVASLDGYSKDERVELRIQTNTIKAGKTVKILAIFSNGEALIESSLAGLNFLNSAGILNRYGIERVKLQDLNKLN